MKIAVFVALFPKLSETFVLNQIIGLIKAGHEVDIFPHYIGDTEVIHEDVHHYKLLERTHFHPDIPQNWLLRVLKAIWLFATCINRKPVALIRSLNIVKYGYKAASLLLFYQAVAIVRTGYDYDLIHCHFGERGNVALTFKELGALKGPLVVSFYGQDLTTFGDKLEAHPYTHLFHEGTLFLPISDFFRQRLIKMGCLDEKIIVNHVGVDIKRFCYTERQREANQNLRILSIARLAEKKGLDIAIKAVAKAHQQGCQCNYAIVGDGPLKEALQEIIIKKEASHFINFIGSKNHDEIEHLITQSDLFLLPSITASTGDMEGIPLALMEASASGMPVLSTWHAGIPELVKDGVSGYLVAERDIAPLSDKIILFANSPELCTEFGKAGRKIVEERFNLEFQNQLLMKLFEKLINKN